MGLDPDEESVSLICDRHDAEALREAGFSVLRLKLWWWAESVEEEVCS
jgi:hypothetical protein